MSSLRRSLNATESAHSTASSDKRHSSPAVPKAIQQRLMLRLSCSCRLPSPTCKIEVLHADQRLRSICASFNTCRGSSLLSCTHRPFYIAMQVKCHLANDYTGPLPMTAFISSVRSRPRHHRLWSRTVARKDATFCTGRRTTSWTSSVLCPVKQRVVVSRYSRLSSALSFSSPIPYLTLLSPSINNF